MKITREQANQLIEFKEVIQVELNVLVGYSCPMGHFVEENCDFVAYETENGNIFLLEANEFAINDDGGFLTQVNYDTDKISQDVLDFLIDFNLLVKSGKLKMPEYQEFVDSDGAVWKWRKLANNKYEVEKIVGEGRIGFSIEELVKFHSFVPAELFKIMKEK